MSSVRVAKADARIAEYNLEKAKLDAANQIRTSSCTITQARERISVASETVELAERDPRGADDAIRVGAGTMLETIDAQVALTQAKADVIQAKCDFLIATADLAVATGKRSTGSARARGDRTMLIEAKGIKKIYEVGATEQPWRASISRSRRTNTSRSWDRRDRGNRPS